MNKKIQNFGLNSKVWRDQITKIAKQVFQNDEILLKRHEDTLQAFSEVSLYGWDKITKNNFKETTIKTVKSFFGDIEKFDDLTFRYSDNPDFVINEHLKKINKLVYFLTRASENLTTTEEEKKYQEIIDNFELFLSAYYDEKLLPVLVEAEIEIKEKLKEIFESEKSDEEKANEAEIFLAEKEQELIEKFVELETVMSDKSIESALLILLLLNIAEPGKSEINRYRKVFGKGYLSNIAGNISTWIRQTDEIFFDIVMLQRASAKDTIEKIKMNKNNFKLSVLSHPKGLLRAITNKQALKNGFTHFKAIVPTFAVGGLSPFGVTQKYLFKIKTQKEWQSIPEATSPNVIDGLSIHHNDQIYYIPTQNTIENAEIAKKQRQVFSSTLATTQKKV